MNEDSAVRRESNIGRRKWTVIVSFLLTHKSAIRRLIDGSSLSMSYVVLELVDVGQTDRGAGGSLFGALQVPRPPNPGYSSM